MRCSVLVVALLTTTLVGQKTALAQREEIFNIPVRTIPFQSQNFSGFAFQVPAFAGQNATQIPFRNIQFRGLYGPVDRSRRSDFGNRLTIGRNVRFSRPFRPVPTALPRETRRYGEIPNVRFARRDPFAAVSAWEVDRTRLTGRSSGFQSRTAARRRSEPAVSRLQLAAERRPFASESRR